MVAIEEPGGRCSGEVDKLRLDSLREERRESWTRDDRPLAAAWTVEHHRWCLVWLRAGWLVSDRNHKRNFKRVTVLAQVRGPAQITRMQREEDALGRCQPGPEPGAWDDAKESPPRLGKVPDIWRAKYPTRHCPAAGAPSSSKPWPQQQPTQRRVPSLLHLSYLVQRHGQSNGSMDICPDPDEARLPTYVQHRQLIQIGRFTAQICPLARTRDRSVTATAITVEVNEVVPVSDNSVWRQNMSLIIDPSIAQVPDPTSRPRDKAWHQPHAAIIHNHPLRLPFPSHPVSSGASLDKLNTGMHPWAAENRWMTTQLSASLVSPEKIWTTGIPTQG